MQMKVAVCCEMPSSLPNSSCWLPKRRMLQDFCFCAPGSVPPKRVLDNVCPRRAAGTAGSSWDQHLLPLVPPAAGPASCLKPLQYASIQHHALVLALPVLPKISLTLRLLPWGWPGSFCFRSALPASPCCSGRDSHLLRASTPHGSVIPLPACRTLHLPALKKKMPCALTNHAGSPSS